jgi:hypothetical protein
MAQRAPVETTVFAIESQHARANTVRVMTRHQTGRSSARVFDRVRRVGLSLPDVECSTRYDGSQVLKAGGCFMAGLATHPSAEPGSLVVRVNLDERQWLLEDAPETYYLTDYYEKYPLVLVRTSHVDESALRDLLTVSHRLTMAKARPRRVAATKDRVSRS